MKRFIFWIKESKLEKVMMKYIQLQKLKMIENESAVFFMGGSSNFADVTYGKYDNVLSIREGFLDSVTSFFSVHESYSEKIVTKYFKEVYKFKIKEVNVFGG